MDAAPALCTLVLIVTLGLIEDVAQTTITEIQPIRVDTRGDGRADFGVFTLIDVLTLSSISSEPSWTGALVRAHPVDASSHWVTLVSFITLINVSTGQTVPYEPTLAGTLERPDGVFTHRVQTAGVAGTLIYVLTPLPLAFVTSVARTGVAAGFVYTAFVA